MSTNEKEILRYSVPVTPELDAEVRRRMQEGGFSDVLRGLLDRRLDELKLRQETLAGG